MSQLAEKLFCITEEDIQRVRQYYGKSEEEITKDCLLIQNWMKQQRHFPDDYDLPRVERLLLRNKFRVEHTKAKLENYYTVRGAEKNLFKNMNPASDGMKKFLPSSLLVPMPKLFNGLERLYIQSFTGHDNDYSLEHNILVLLALFEMELKHEYAAGLRFIVDFEGFTSSHLKRMDVNLLSRSFFLYKECLSARIISLEFINMPSIMNAILEILKLALPEKLYKKITLHKNLESLAKTIPREYLPNNYGGILRSTGEIYEDVKQFLMENKEYLMNRTNIVSNENKRVGEVIKNEMFGVDGTFKQMNLD